MHSRPRWGILSTRAHLDPGALVPDLLLYDRLVFPVPADDDLERWATEGWKPDDLRKCLDLLGPLAHSVTWSKELRDEWGTRFASMDEAAKQADGIAFGMTPMVIGMSAWKDVHSTEAESAPPVPIAAFQSAEEARAAVAYEPRAPASESDVHAGVAVLFRQCLAMPRRTHGPVEGMLAFERAIDLSRSKSYQQARRAFYDWEDGVTAQRWPVDDAVGQLKKLMIEHDALVRSRFPDAAIRVALRIVGIASGAAVGAVVGGPAGAALGGALGPFVGALADAATKSFEEATKSLVESGVENLVEMGSARLPRFRRSESASVSPGALLSMSVSALHS